MATKAPKGGLAVARSGGRNGIYRRLPGDRVGYCCEACGLPFIAGRTYARTWHDRPFVAGRPMHWDDDLEMESLITGAPVLFRRCYYAEYAGWSGFAGPEDFVRWLEAA